MAERISSQTKDKVIALWLQGKTRDEIAMIVQISAGSVSKIITKWQTELEDRVSCGKRCGGTIKEAWNEYKR